MKVAMSVEQDSDNARVDERFGRCRYFAVVDTDTKSVTFVANDASESSGAGVKAARALLKQGIDAVIVGNIGPKAFEVLARAGIPVYGGLTGTIQESLELFIQGKLGKMDMPNN
ncbi:MAG TPA: dinitrogenase iron-molybdenum cofactor biosynthesis protein [Syntrophothermus lipocalidus]|uniref:Dinitrogenase iron-molybdenum cofactor biosynthesis protein n=1 Tax=Syntrophothermus lipocalidus (strain DSM 12680 / TGB-C1) TaxID=643648 RepID=D7CK07_SYNLT|nr:MULTISPECIES: NifB/NifX family molybdenum-iron cluster-binding protein [Syntrophothermus]ADI01121.1 Dinitrogenase iron-molybdenum cofactor biosynthesis protein [Syntrophothermus lipocalidus DSM 12680]NSW81790.1 NifB/NifX family molybdenum-iron cluster-binding protein [Syntrophothermus sp.]HHV77952.1 dinitrogenase iron-molybdenum cofactor biosynthesis protein [Syntrophothermus lipocalidus]HOV43202.1 NifB/NifX family molybdenum-iron cluster-binding protein [Syntrophothermus lipocalidus]